MSAAAVARTTKLMAVEPVHDLDYGNAVVWVCLRLSPNDYDGFAALPDVIEVEVKGRWTRFVKRGWNSDTGAVHYKWSEACGELMVARAAR